MRLLVITSQEKERIREVESYFTLKLGFLLNRERVHFYQATTERDTKDDSKLREIVNSLEPSSVIYVQNGISVGKDLEQVGNDIVWKKFRPGNFNTDFEPRFLDRQRVNVIDAVTDFDRDWEIGLVDRHRIFEWLNQFERLNEKAAGWWALRILDLWSSNEYLDAIAGNGFDQFDNLFILDGTGSDNKVRGILSNVAREHKIKTLKDGSSTLGYPDKNSILVTDNICSGRQFLATLCAGGKVDDRDIDWRDLVGTNPENSPIANLNTTSFGRLKANEGSLVIRSALITDLAVERLNFFFKSTGISNVSFDTDRASLLRFLRSKQSSEIFDDKLILKTDIRPAFITRLFQCGLEQAQIDRISSIYRKINEQLVMQMEDMEPSWHFGTENQGLTSIFPNSIPRSTLPFYYFGGKIEIGGKQIDWIPLFPGRH